MYRAAVTADHLSKELENLQTLKRKVNELDEEMTDKLDYTIKKISTRNNMREHREKKSEDLSKPHGGILGHGPTE